MATRASDNLTESITGSVHSHAHLHPMEQERVSFIQASSDRANTSDRNAADVPQNIRHKGIRSWLQEPLIT